MGMFAFPATDTTLSISSRGAALELSSARITGPAPSGVLAKRGLSSGESEETKVSTACTRSEEHTSELQSLMRISYAVFCLKKKKNSNHKKIKYTHKSIITHYAATTRQ